MFKDKGEPLSTYSSAEAYRQRHVLEGFEYLGKILTKRR